MTSLLHNSLSITESIYEQLAANKGQIDASLLEHILTEVDHLLLEVDSILHG